MKDECPRPVNKRAVFQNPKALSILHAVLSLKKIFPKILLIKWTVKTVYEIEAVSCNSFSVSAIEYIL